MVNPAIAMGVKQLELPDPLAQYGKIAAIQQAQNQNALAQYQLGAAQRAETRETARMNALAGAGANEDAIANALLRSGDIKGFADFQKSRSERETQALTRQKTEGDILDSALKRSRGLLDTIDPNDPEAANMYIAWHEANHADPVIGKMLASRGITAEQSRGRIMAALQQPGGLANLINQSRLGTEKFMELNKPSTQVIDQGGQRQVIQLPGLGGAPTTVGTYADVPLPADVAAQQAQLRAAGASRNINVLPPQEKAERVARGAMLVDQYKGIATSAQVAAKALPALETQERVLDTGFRTGFGAAAQTEAARFLSALGVANAKEYAKNSEGFSAAASQAVLQRQLEQKGVQTEADAQRISQTGAQLGNTPEGNKFIISVARAQFKNDINQRNFYDAWWKKNGTYDGAEDAWFSGPGSKSLFESPELKQFAAPKPGKERPSLQSIFK